MSAEGERLLGGADDPTITVNEEGHSSLFLVCEHAGRTIPKSLGSLGLPAHEFERHIAYDIGAEQVARGLSKDSTRRLFCSAILGWYTIATVRPKPIAQFLS
jgi:predicted N-formylglutamate amidohydrolase